MKKDVIIAVVIGFVIGGAAALGVTNLPALLKNTQKTTAEKIAATISPSPEPSKTTNGETSLSVEQPEQDSLLPEKIVFVTGKSKPGNLVVVETDLESQATEVKENGTFSAKITVGEGSNTILVNSYDDAGNEDSKSVTVFYTPEKL